MTGRARLALAMMALLTLIAVVYAPVHKGVFIWDDHALIERSRVVERASISEIFSQPYWTASSLSDVQPSYYRPITMLTLRADHAVAGPEPRSFHVSNLLLHLLATIVFVLVARRLGATPGASLVAAAVWALHPRTTEAVAWISGRADVLAGLMAMIAIGVWPWYAEADADAGTGATGARSGAGSGRPVAVACLAVLVGLLAKEVAIAAAVGIGVGTVVGARGRGREGQMRAGRRLAWLALPLAAYAALRLGATRATPPSRLSPLGLEARAATALEAIGRYLEMTFDPWHPATSIGLVGEIDHGSVVLGAIAATFLVALAGRAVARRGVARSTPHLTPEPGRGAMAALAALGLTSLGLVLHVIPIALASGVAADRLLYLPLAALGLALTVAASRLSRSRRTVLGVLATALAATFVPVTRARAADYTDELRFRVAAAEHAHPRSTSAKSGLANLLRAEAETDLACALHLSVRETLERYGHTGTRRYIRGLENLGGCYAAVGRYADAEQTYAVIERLEPNHPRLHMELGYLRLHTFDVARAETEFRRALELDPDLQPARASLAALPELRLLLAHFATEPARRADPVGWARLLTNLGRIPEATAAWTAIVTAPDVDKSTAWNGLEHLLANADTETARRTAELGIARDVFGAETIKLRLAKRLRQQARVDALRPRIEALAGSKEGPRR